MSVIPLHEAWSILGKDINIIAKGITGLVREEQVLAISALSEEAKRLARPLLVKHHPDLGGDIDEFKRVQGALAAVIYHSEKFKEKVAEISQKAAETASRRPVFIDIKK